LYALLGSNSKSGQATKGNYDETSARTLHIAWVHIVKYIIAHHISLVGDVLRNPHRRERYDFFLKNGFPEWSRASKSSINVVRTGKDYLYSRFRPGLALTLIFLFLFISGMQYLFHSLTASRQRAHIDRYIEQVKEIAWRPHGGQAPLSGAKKYITLGDQSEDGDGRSRKFAIDFMGNVYLIDPDTGAENLLDVNEIEGASWKRTLLYSLPMLVWRSTVGRLLKKGEVEPVKEAGASGEVKEDAKSSDMSNHVKAEKIAGKRRVKRKN
jgi:hypothetical protein